MSQPSVASYFATRKRRASEELRNKSKVLILDGNDKRETLAIISEERAIKTEQVPAKGKTKMETKRNTVVRNLQFDLGVKSSKPASKTKLSRSKQPIISEDNRQLDIRETLLKVNKEIEDEKKVVFEKLGCLSPKKSSKAQVSRTSKSSKLQEKIPDKSQEPAYFKTPTKEPQKLNEMTFDDIKTKVITSSRLTELRARIAKLRNFEDKLEKLDEMKQKRKDEVKVIDKVKIKQFDHIELEIPVSPQRLLQSPKKFFSPTKTIELPPNASPARRLLFEPKEAPASPVKASPSKIPAYQKFQSLIETEGKVLLPLPYKYRFLAEVFRSIDTVSAMLYNRNEIITYNKLKPAVQELIRRNFTLDHLAQIKTIYPNAYNFEQKKMRSFGTANPEKYELVLSPILEISSEKSGRNTPDAENVLKSALETHMGPCVLLERRRKFYSELLEIVKDEHDKFLLDLDPPMRLSKDKITRWHPEFDTEMCKDIEKAQLPEIPVQQKVMSAKDVLEKANKLCNNSSRMKKALELLAENRVKSNATNTNTDIKESSEAIKNVEISIVDTPPATPTIQKPIMNSALKGIPQALLERVRARQAAKTLEMMTRSSDATKDAKLYSRLPDLAKILRNIFVSEKKSVLTIEFVIKKLDDSLPMNLSSNELDESIRLLCKLLPSWATIHVVRKAEYLKLAKDIDMAKVIHRLEVLADEKL